MPYVETEDCRLHYVEQGEGDPIIFLHGFTLDHRQWTDQVEFFANPDSVNGLQYRAVALDARGHGKSEAPATGYSRRHRVLDLKAFIDALGIDRFHLVGLSMGGTTGIGFALEYPGNLKSLTLVSSAAAGYSVGKKISSLDQMAKEQGIDAVKERWKRMTLSYYKPDQRHIADLMTKMVDDFSGATWKDVMRGKYPREEDLPRLHQIAIPTLIMAGEVDKIFHAVAEKLHERIAGSRFISYPKVGHMVNLEIPEQFNIDLKAFLDSVD